MAGGRDLLPRSPRWLNGIIWSSGLGAAAWFIWRLVYCDVEPTCLPPSIGVVLPKAFAFVAVPIIFAVSVLTRAVQWVRE